MKLFCEFCDNPGTYGYFRTRERMFAVVCVEHREAYHEPIEMPDGTVSIVAIVTWLRDRATRLNAEHAQDVGGAGAIEAAARALEQGEWRVES